MAPALVGAGEEAREESRAKKLAASSTADWVEVACPPADARESDSGSRGLKGGTGELDPEGYAVMPSRHECSPVRSVRGHLHREQGTVMSRMLKIRSTKRRGL